MITTITGPNDFLRITELKSLIDEFTQQFGDMALEKIDGEDASFERLSDAVQSLPFLSTKKLVVLYAPSQQKQFVASSETLLDKVSELTDVVIVEPKLDKRSTYFKFLKQKTTFKEYLDLSGNGLSDWVVNYAKNQAGSISRGDAAMLVGRVGPNQQLLKNEVDKLLLYEPNISRQTIELLSEPTPQSTIFELVDSALRGNRAQTIKLYEEQRSLRVEPAQILSILAWQLHVLAVIKTAPEQSADAIARSSHLNPFVVNKSLILARRISFEQLKQMVASALELDLKIKTKNIDANEALTYFLLGLSI